MHWKRWAVGVVGGYLLVRGLWPTLTHWWAALWLRWGLPWHTLEAAAGGLLVVGALALGRRRKLPAQRPPRI